MRRENQVYDNSEDGGQSGSNTGYATRGEGLDAEIVHSRYNLSLNQRTGLLSSGLTASDREAVATTRDHLPERFQHLFTEVALLKEAGLLDRQTWNDDAKVEAGSFFESGAEFWSELSSARITKRLSRYDDVMMRVEENGNKEFQFGFDLGSIVWMLKSNAGQEMENVDLIWGFILAFIGQPARSSQREKRLLADLIGDIEQREQNRQADAYKYDFSDYDPTEIEFEQAIKNGIQQAGIAPAPSVVQAVSNEIRRPADEDESVVKSVIQQEAKMSINDIRERVPLDEIDELFSHLSDDIHELERHTRPGVDSTVEILRYLWAADHETDTELMDESGPVRSEKIASELSCNQKNISEVCNKIAAEPDWTSFPIVVTKPGSNSRGAMGPWKLTTYGKLVCHTLFSHEGDPSWVFRQVIPSAGLPMKDQKLLLDTVAETDIFEL